MESDDRSDGPSRTGAAQALAQLDDDGQRLERLMEPPMWFICAFSVLMFTLVAAQGIASGPWRTGVVLVVAVIELVCTRLWRNARYRRGIAGKRVYGGAHGAGISFVMVVVFCGIAFAVMWFIGFGGRRWGWQWWAWIVGAVVVAGTYFLTASMAVRLRVRRAVYRAQARVGV